MTGGGWNWILIISKDGLKMCLVESSKCDNSLKCTWMLSHVELEGGGGRKKAFILVNLIVYLGKMRKPATKLKLDGLLLSGTEILKLHINKH